MTQKTIKVAKNPMLSAEELRLALMSKRAPKDGRGKMLKVKHKSDDPEALRLALLLKRAPRS